MSRPIWIWMAMTALKIATAMPTLTSTLGELGSGFPRETPADAALRSQSFVPWNHLDPFFAAVVQCVEEATLNVLVNNETMTGRKGHTSHALPHDLVVERLAAHGRLADS